MEPDEHCKLFGSIDYFNNALMVTPPCHPFFEYILTHIHTTTFFCTGNKMMDVLTSTGPMMLTKLYASFPDKHLVELFPAELVSPLAKMDVQNFLNKKVNDEYLEKKSEKAIAVHYFLGSWL